MQDCQLVESHKSASSGPVRSLEAVPARKQTRKQTKNNKQKQAKNTQPQQKQNKNDTEKWDWWHLMCYYENVPKQETKQKNYKTHQWAMLVGEK